MNSFYIDCSMGAAGDMLTGALLELMPSRDAAVDMLNSMGIPGIIYGAEDSTKRGVTGTHVTVTYYGEEEVTEDSTRAGNVQADAHGHTHEHVQADSHGHTHEHIDAHGHPHAHEHADAHSRDHHSHGVGMAEISDIIGNINVPDTVKHDISGVYGIIAEAESLAHGVPVSEVHFHEVGSMDAVADAAAVCLLMHELSPAAVKVSDIHTGTGTVICAHGEIDVPAPATVNILAGIPTYSDGTQGELCTPTGAALLRYFGTEFGGGQIPSSQDIIRTGRGMGRKDFDRPNCVTIHLLK